MTIVNDLTTAAKKDAVILNLFQDLASVENDIHRFVLHSNVTLASSKISCTFCLNQDFQDCLIKNRDIEFTFIHFPKYHLTTKDTLDLQRAQRV